MMFGAASRSPSSSPNPPYQNYVYQLPTSPHYNIPQHSPNPLPAVPVAEDPIHESLRAANINIMDLDVLNVQQPQQAQPVTADDVLNDFRTVNLPLTDSNLQLIDSHLFSNLSIHDVDDPPKDGQREESMSSTSIPPELPVLTFSGMLSSADLDGADGFGRTANNNS